MENKILSLKVNGTTGAVQVQAQAAGLVRPATINDLAKRFETSIKAQGVSAWSFCHALALWVDGVSPKGKKPVRLTTADKDSIGTACAAAVGRAERYSAAWVMAHLKAGRAWPNQPKTAEECADFVDAVGGNASRKAKRAAKSADGGLEAYKSLLARAAKKLVGLGMSADDVVSLATEAATAVDAEDTEDADAELVEV